MNIHEFFNSKDIAEYCKSIDYKFSAIETAYMVWYSDHHTIAEKHKAWQEIIDTMPDEEFHSNWDMRGHSLHSFLQAYMRLQNEYIDNFCQTQTGYVYTYDITDWNDNLLHENDVIYSNYEACLSTLKKYEIDDDAYNEISTVKMIRHCLYESPTAFCDAIGSEAIIYNKNLEPLELQPRNYNAEDEMNLLDVPYGFYNMWVAIPVPFKKGDIVTVKHTKNSINGKCKPFVLELVPWRRRNGSNDDINENREYWLNFGVDWTDMDLCAWFQDDNGELSWDHKFCYLDLEYYRDAFEGTENFLVAVSNCMQGKITTEDLLRSHSIILMENYANEMRKYFYDNKELLNACGLEYNGKSKDE